MRRYMPPSLQDVIVSALKQGNKTYTQNIIEDDLIALQQDVYRPRSTVDLSR